MVSEPQCRSELCPSLIQAPRLSWQRGHDLMGGHSLLEIWAEGRADRPWDLESDPAAGGRGNLAAVTMGRDLAGPVPRAVLC